MSPSKFNITGLWCKTGFSIYVYLFQGGRRSGGREEREKETSGHRERQNEEEL